MIQWKKKFLPLALLAVLAVGLAGCGGQGDNGQSAGSSDKEIKIGATAGPHAEVVEAVAKEAEKQGIHIKVVWRQEVHCRQIQRYDRTG